MKKFKNNLLYALYWIFHYSGIRFLWHMVQAPKEDGTDFKLEKMSHIAPFLKRKPSNFFIWFLGIYGAAFGLSSNQYEQEVSRLRSDYEIIVSQLSSDQNHVALQQLPTLSTRNVPLEPEFWNPFVTFSSFFRSKGEDSPLSETVSSTVESILDEYIEKEIPINRFDFERLKVSAELLPSLKTNSISLANGEIEHLIFSGDFKNGLNLNKVEADTMILNFSLIKKFALKNFKTKYLSFRGSFICGKCNMINTNNLDTLGLGTKTQNEFRLIEFTNNIPIYFFDSDLSSEFIKKYKNNVYFFNSRIYNNNGKVESSNCSNLDKQILIEFLNDLDRNSSIQDVTTELFELFDNGHKINNFFKKVKWEHTGADHHVYCE